MTATVNLAAASNSSSLLPHGVWDTHHHVFDPAKFAYAEDRHLTPPPATVQQFLDFKQRVGITRSVLTHGLSYGDDCRSLKSFLDELGGTDTKGVGVLDPDTITDRELHEMHSAGVRGVRVNLYKYKAMHDVQLQKKALREHLRAVRRCPGWSMAFTHTHPEFWGDLKSVVNDEIATAGVRLVTDHFALLKGASMLPPEYQADVTKQPGFQDVVDLLRTGNLWVKLSAPYRVSEMKPGYEDLKPVVQALVQANPRRVLWGSDWPHTPRMKVRNREEAVKEAPYLEVDDVAWLRSLKSWLTDEQWKRLMIENPRELYDW